LLQTPPQNTVKKVASNTPSKHCKTSQFWVAFNLANAGC
jgi:hypothetical protein